MEMQEQGQSLPRVRAPKNAYVQLAALLGIALVALIATWLLMRGGSSSKVSLPPVGQPAIVTETQLRALATQSANPIYWAGARAGAYEFTRTTDGRSYVRYLHSPSEVGTRSAKFLTVGTYPAKRAWLEIQRAARHNGGLSLKISNGGLLVFNTSTPTSVYFGYPSAKYQVEVYDPSPTEARSLVLGGRVVPVH